uniref:Uncharacterized protein n=1 Tax=Candidatus Kentrum sp. TC TaxID=2126339 RepID=A0A450YP98_9GAMM|nr:MAG: hypothetical protein BECKTC1821E_GA0114239_10259 [Candidatus Kentron sp. TC]
MIEETGIVQDTRRIRSDISEKFGNDCNRYIDFLQTKRLKTSNKKTSEPHGLKEFLEPYRKDMSGFMFNRDEANEC